MQLTPESSARPDDPHLPNDGHSLPAAVAVAAVALFLALACVLWLTLRTERRQLIEQAYASADRVALRLAVHAGEVISRADRATQVIKSVRENGHAVNLATLTRDRLTSEEVASAFLVTDRQGVVIDTTSPGLALNLGDEDLFKQLAHQDDAGLVIGPSIQDSIRGGWVIPLMRRIDGPAGFEGAVVALIRPHALVLGSLEERSDSMMRSVVGLDGLLRARRLRGAVTVDGKVSDPLNTIQKLQDLRAEGKIDISPIDGRGVTPAAAAVSGYPLLAIAANSALDIEADYAAVRDRTLAWGSAAALLLMVGAITLWQQARQLEASRRAARRASALYVATLEGSLDSLWLMDPVLNAKGRIVDFTVIEANRRSLDLMRLTRDQVIGKRFGDLVPASKTDGLLPMLARVHRTGKAFDIEAPGTADPLLGLWIHTQAVPAGDSIALIVRDITERREAAQQVAEREVFMRTLLDALPVAIYAKSARAADHGQLRFWNKAAERQFGLTAEQAIGRTTHAYLPGVAMQAILQDTEVARERRVMAFPDLGYETESGMRYLDLLKAPVFGVDGEIDMILVIAEDVTHQRAAAEQLRLVSRIVQETGDAVLLSDRRGRIVLANAAFAKITGRALGDLSDTAVQDIGLPALSNGVLAGVEEALREHRHWAGESPLPRLQGAALETWLTVSAITDETGATTHHVWLFSDISVLKAQERQLAELARCDALTQLSNRRHFEEELEAATARARRHGQPLALIYLDLDGFKQVNDSLGHEAGDRLLIEVAHRLRAAVRSTDLVSRLGGDEFTVILEYAGTPAERALQCQRLLDELSRPHELAGRRLVSTPSIGIAVYDPTETIESLRHRADVAMYQAKRSGKGQVRTSTESALA